MVPPNEAAAPERWQQIETLFAQARVLPPAERDAFLKTACDDPTLRAELDRLLASYDQADHFLDNLDTGRAAALLHDEDLTDEPIIGPYRLVREVGRGGMGTVYLAERATGQFQQQVALKLIKRGMDSDAILRRFLHERQILARLHHPSIARLYDGDMTDDGRPYFAMEYVEGTSITTYCDEHRLDIEARLRLFQEVCRAVQYAHQNLVVHRDLKPSNMLVTDKGELKLLDFGIARLLNEDAEAGTMLTEAGYRVMTPEYAAPEQVQGAAITTATDVYALGVVLYELLTGHRPYQFEQRTPEAIARHLAETEPERPSTVVRRTTETITPEAVGQQRRLAPDRLQRRLSGDLDTVLLKALRKEPERRYASAEAFLEDIRRHLNGLPVHARKDTMAYRTAKFIRRHTAGVVAAAAFIVLLAGFAVTQTLQQAETARERDKAEVVKDFVLSLFEASNPAIEAKGDAVTARELLERGEARIDAELEKQPEIQAEMLAVVGNAYKELGQYERAEPLLERALALRQDHLGNEHPDVARSLRDLGSLRFSTGDYDAADSLKRQALILSQQLHRRAHPDVARSLSDLAVVSRARGNYDEADSLGRLALTMRRTLLGDEHQEVALSLNNLGVLLHYKGDYDEAEPMLREALAIRRNLLGNEHLDVSMSLQNLALLLRDQGNYEPAEPMLREALTIRRNLLGDKHPEVAQSLNMLASLLRRKGDYRQAETVFAEALAMRRELLGDAHPDIAQSLNNLAIVLGDQGNYEAAEPLYREALAMWRKLLGDEHPDVALGLQNLAVVLRRQGDYEAAEPLLREALAMRRELLGEEHPDVTVTMNNLAILLSQKGDYEAAEPLARQIVVRWRRQLGDEHPDVALGLNNLARLMHQQGDYNAADSLFREALDLYRQQLPEKHPRMAPVLAGQGRLLLDQGQPEQAEPLLREALTILEQALPETHWQRAEVQSLLGTCLAAQQRFDEAEPLLLAGYDRLRTARGEQDSYTQKALNHLVDLYTAWGKPDQARAYLALQAP